HLGLADNHFNAVGALEGVDLDVQVQLTHALEDGFAGVLVGFHLESGILGNHLADGDAHLLGAALVLGRDGDGDHRIREDHGFQVARVVWIAQGVTGLDVLHADNGDDVAGLGATYFIAVVGVHFHHAADTLGLAGGGIEDGHPLFDDAGIDAYKGQGTEAVIHDLERQGAERLALGDQGNLAGGSPLGVGEGLGFNFSGVGQVVDNRIEEHLHALVLEGGAAEGGEEVQLDGALANAALEVFHRGLFAFHVGHHQVVVLFDGGFHQLVVVELHVVRHIGGNVGDHKVFGQSGVIPD